MDLSMLSTIGDFGWCATDDKGHWGACSEACVLDGLSTESQCDESVWPDQEEVPSLLTCVMMPHIRASTSVPSTLFVPNINMEGDSTKRNLARADSEQSEKEKLNAPNRFVLCETGECALR
jgi:hypothetical protein